MKKIYGFAALCAAMTLASCSNENEPNLVDNGAKDAVFLKVKIAGAGATRANSAEALNDAAATDAELVINSASFVLFNASGTAIAVNNDVTIPDLEKGSNDITGTAAMKDTPIPFAINAGEEPAYVMCGLNCDITSGVNLGSTTVDEIRVKTTAYATNTDANTGFIMSNAAVHADGNSSVKMYCSPVTAENYSVDENEAKNNKTAANIYVERVAARVGYYMAEGLAAPTGKATDKDGNEVDVTVEIQSIKVTNKATVAYTVKDVKDLSTYNDANNYRSHWANTIAEAGLTQFTLSSAGSNKALATATEAAPGLVTYMCENTKGSTDASEVVVVGRLKIDGADATGENTIYYTTEGYTTQGGMENVINETLKNQGYLVKLTAGGTRTLTAADWDLTKSTSNSYAMTVTLGTASDGTIEKWGTPVAANAKALSGDDYTVYRYTDAQCYYYTTIKDDQEREGIVRNHVYNIGIMGIAGLGIPMHTPGNNVDPENPDPLKPGDTPDNWYLNCTVNVLNWAVYKQEVSFGTPQDKKD